jgi:hypothetical protein
VPAVLGSAPEPHVNATRKALRAATQELRARKSAGPSTPLPLSGEVHAATSAEGTTLFAAARDKLVAVVDRFGAPVCKLELSGEPSGVAVHPNGLIVVATWSDGRLNVLRLCNP